MVFENVCRIPGKTGWYEIKFKGDTLRELIPVEKPDTGVKTLWFTKGLFDIQVNGMLGHNLSEEDLDKAKVAEIEHELEKHGILRWCPTITTQNASIVKRNLAIIRDAIKDKSAFNIHCVHMVKDK